MARVLVMGGGPAGACFATRMAMLGHRITLVEQARFPRRRVGESLSPGVLPMLATIGADQPIRNAGFHPVDAVLTQWEGAPTTRHDPRSEGLIVDRGRFDQLLLRHAQASGVEVRQPDRARHLAWRDGEGWQAEFGDGTSASFDFLAYATGRGHGGRGTAVRTIALYGWWRGMGLSPTPQIRTGDGGWFWGVPLPDGSSNLLAFADARSLKALPGTGLAARYRALIAQSGLLPADADARLEGSAEAIDATPNLHPDLVSDRHIRIGDAAVALDPLSSSGVQKAIQNALSGAIVANTLLAGTDPEAAIAFHRNRLAADASRHARWARSHYARAAASRPDRFWADRSGGSPPDPDPPLPMPPPVADVPLVMSPAARLVETPCLGARFVVRHMALAHPALDGPIAFVADTALAPLLAGLRSGMTLADIGRSWSRTHAPAKSLAIAAWLVNNGILVADTAAARPEHGRARTPDAMEGAGVRV